MPTLTKDSMALKDLPKHAGPEEFLDDAGLAALYERELAVMKAKDPKRAELQVKLARARVAAALTDQVLAEPLAEDQPA